MSKNIMIYSNFNKNMSLEFQLIESQASGFKVAVAVSGGSDSIALCLLMNNWIKQFNGELYAITIDHGLRKESSIEAQKVNEILGAYNIQHCIIPWIGEKPKANIQEKARIARYSLLTEYCQRNHIKYLATGHQKNDQAENFLIRLERGSGVYGLSGIPKVTEYNGVTIIRPLLKFPKEDLQNFLKLQDCEWIEDLSNQNEHFTRVRMRKVINQHPEMIDNFVTVGENLSRVKVAIEYYVNLNLKELIKYIEPNIISFEFDKFNILPQEIRFRMLEKLLQQISNNAKPARGERIERLLNKLLSGKEFKASTLSDCLISRKKHLIFIELENKPKI